MLGPEDPPPFTVLNPDSTRPVLFVCDHAANRVPAALDNLGLTEAQRQTHIGWDIGAEALTRLLAERFKACAVLTTYSRLVVDSNRAPGDPAAIPVVSDGVLVPGNRDLDDGAAEQRTDALFWPYHHAIADRIAHLWRHGPPPALVAMHTCTPVMDGFERPWHFGLLYNHDDRMARAMLTALAERDPSLCLGDNLPYSGKQVGFTVNTHAEPAGLPNLGVEVRQDLVGDPAGVAHWGGLFGDALEKVLADPDLYVCRVS